MMKRSLTVFCLIVWIVVLSACVSVKPIYYEDDKVVARKKVEQIHQLYNAGDFGAVYELLTERLKNETTKDVFIATFTEAKKTNGPFIEGKEIDSQVVPVASYREVRFKFSSKFEKGWCNEGFAIFVDGDNAIVDVLMLNPANGPTQPTR